MNLFPRFVLAALSMAPTLASAVQLPTPSLQPADPNDPADRLGRDLRVLSSSPRDLEALTGAGRAALDVGDANAAIGFFGRAQEVAPRDGRVKAGLAAALVQMEQPKEALKLFDQAVDLGVPVASIAEDRGLAYDLRGDNKRAQADYRIALLSAPNDETVRRLALSQAMSGDRAGALATLDPLLRKQDKAAWRASTFVLAITGDAGAAVQRLTLLVPAAQASRIAPFLGRLGSLKASEQAQAVHFGHLPSDARAPSATTLATATSPSATGQALVPAGAPLGGPAASGYADAFAASRRAEPAARAARRRPGSESASAMSALPAPGFSAAGDPVRPTQLASAAPVPRAAPVAPPPAVAVPVAAPVPVPTPSPVVALAPVEVAAAVPAAGVPVVDGMAAISTYRQPPTDVAVATVPIAASLATPVAPVEKVEPPQVDEALTARREAAAEAKASRLAAQKEAKAKAEAKLAAVQEAKAKADAKLATAKEAKAKKDKLAADAKKKQDLADAKAAAAKAKKDPQRYWVQVATGANKADLPKAWSRVKAQYPQVMAGKSAWTTPLRFTNRLLVGPFKSAEEAQGFVNGSAKAGFRTSSFTSPSGQAVERLGGR